MMDKFYWFLLVGFIAFILGAWARGWIAAARLRDCQAGIQELAKSAAAAQEIFDTTMASTEAYLQQEKTRWLGIADEYRVQLEREKVRSLEYKRKADEYLAKIEEVIAERETWRALYNDQAGGHDNAQALMLDAINKLLHVYRRDTGKSPQLDPMIELVRGEWVSVHGDEARENLGSDGKPKDSDRKPA